MSEKPMSSDEKEKPSITPAPNGPYLVKGFEKFNSRKGSVATQPTMALCRCGGSANKPFCDGTHSKNGFSSDKEEGRREDKRESYQGEKIMIHDNRGICAHAGRCTDGLPSVFRLRQEPFVAPNEATRDEIIETVIKCPSGALSYSIDGVEYHGQEGDPAIFIAPNGPYVVTGSPDLVGTPCGEGASTARLTLCRCGGSKNKPFCDGTHWSINFNDDKN